MSGTKRYFVGPPKNRISVLGNLFVLNNREDLLSFTVVPGLFCGRSFRSSDPASDSESMKSL